MRARAALYHHVQALFETHLRGVFRLDQAVHHMAPPVEKVPGRRERAFGKVKEIVTVSFGGYELMLASPHEVPPLGRATLRKDDETIAFGPLDEGTFTIIGRTITRRETGAAT